MYFYIVEANEKRRSVNLCVFYDQQAKAANQRFEKVK